MTEHLLASELRARLREWGLRFSKNTLYGLAKQREVTVTPLGGRIYFHWDSFEAYLRRNTVPAKRNFFGTRGLSQRERSFGSSAIHTTQDKGVAGVGQ